ncbi:hypothetical protein EQ718_21875 (plasmid) [Paracoccus versutus]|nr:hypothetical protein EQ718_21875 [Paracoccus versutus]
MIGPNGEGKTSLPWIIKRLSLPDTGRVSVEWLHVATVRRQRPATCWRGGCRSCARTII